MKISIVYDHHNTKDSLEHAVFEWEKNKKRWIQ